MQLLVFIFSILFTLGVGYIDFISGDLSLMLLYAIPILTTSWYCNKTNAFILAFIAAGCWFISAFYSSNNNQINLVVFLNAISRLGIFILLAYTVSLQNALKNALNKEKIRADTDKLTGLLNKSAFKHTVEYEVLRSNRYGRPLSLAFIDLDNFKFVNDNYGHSSGDLLLKKVGETLLKSIRVTDISGRIGGDEFTICFLETDETQARIAIKKITHELNITINQCGFGVTASIGVITTKGNVNFESLLKKSDELMYKVKKNGKNSAMFLTL